MSRNIYLYVRDKQGQPGTKRDKTGGKQGKTGTSRDRDVMKDNGNATTKQSH